MRNTKETSGTALVNAVPPLGREARGAYYFFLRTQPAFRRKEEESKAEEICPLVHNEADATAVFSPVNMCFSQSCWGLLGTILF